MIDYDKNKKRILLITIILLIIEIILLIFFVKKKIDKYILYIGIYGQILLMVSLKYNKKYLIELSHIIFVMVLLCIILFSYTNFMNVLCSIILFITIITRMVFDGCLFETCVKNNVRFFKNIPSHFVFTNMFLILLLKLIIIN